MLERREGVPIEASAYIAPLLAEHVRRVEEAARPVMTDASAVVDPEQLHDFRVALRRLRTLLASSERLFKSEPFARARRALRALARTAGAARDEEVLAETIAAIEVKEAFRAEILRWLQGREGLVRDLRARVTAALRGAADEAPDGGLSAALHLTGSLPLRRKAGDVQTAELAFDALRDACRRVHEEAERSNAASPKARHQLRIRWKRVRYTAEMLSDALRASGASEEGLAELTQAAVTMQKRLGALHDIHCAETQIAADRALPPGARRALRKSLRAARKAATERVEEALGDALLVAVSAQRRSASTP